jgi:uncharacterized protein YutE (UPF0331/DUF86 family)
VYKTLGHETFDILRENQIIDNKLCTRLLKMVGFRNILTHGYANLDYKKVIEILKSGLNDIGKLIECLR